MLKSDTHIVLSTTAQCDAMIEVNELLIIVRQT